MTIGAVVSKISPYLLKVSVQREKKRDTKLLHNFVKEISSETALFSQQRLILLRRWPLPPFTL